NSPEQGPIRILAAFVPPSRNAEKMMDRWLRVKDRELVQPTDSLKALHSSKNKGSRSLQNIGRPFSLTIMAACYRYYEDIGWLLSTCEDIVVEPNDDFERGGGSSSGEGSGGGSNSGFSSGWLSGGGASGGGTGNCSGSCGGSTDDQGLRTPCETTNPTAYCNEEKSKPCLGDPIDSPKIA